MSTIKKSQFKQKNWFECLQDPRIDKILQLTELYEHGLTEKEIKEILDKKGDKGIPDAIKQLVREELLIKNYGNHPKIVLTYLKGNLERIGTGQIGTRKAWKPTKNPITVLFDKIKPSTITEEENIIFEELKKDISERWKNSLLAYDFNSEYGALYRNLNEYEKIFLDLNQKLSEAKIKDPAKIEELRKIQENLKENQRFFLEDSKRQKEQKQYLQKNLIDLMKAVGDEKDPKHKLFETHIEYIVLILERIIQEEFITYYTNYYKYIETETLPKINIKRIEFIDYLDYVLKTGDKITPYEMIKNGIAGELVDRLRNLKGNIELAIDQKRIKERLNNKEELEKELKKQREKIL